MRVVVGEILPLALVVCISPINVIPVILLLFTKRPRFSASCYLVGFIGGVAGLLVAGVAIAGAVNLSPDSTRSTWAGILKLALGTYLLVAAIRKFRGRPGEGETASLPKWMDGIAGFTPGKSLGTGVALGAFNPKNLVVGLAAAVTIASAYLSTGQQAGAVVIYVFVAVLGVTTPVLVAVLLGDRSREVLDAWKTWLDRNNATVMSVLFLIFGVVLIGQGIQVV